MQTILLIRHAKAKDREKWTGPDDQRPLTAAGHKQAEAIAEELGGSRIKVIRTSPSVRCVQTVEPLAHACGVKVRIDDTLKEGSRIDLPDPDEAGIHVLCAHADNIPALLEELDIEWKECRKASIWMLKRDDEGEITDVTYVEPPEE
jgi:broad specificity phosphatase PhoE